MREYCVPIGLGFFSNVTPDVTPRELCTWLTTGGNIIIKMYVFEYCETHVQPEVNFNVQNQGRAIISGALTILNYMRKWTNNLIVLEITGFPVFVTIH